MTIIEIVTLITVYNVIKQPFLIKSTTTAQAGLGHCNCWYNIKSQLIQNITWNHALENIYT